MLNTSVFLGAHTVGLCRSLHGSMAFSDSRRLPVLFHARCVLDRQLTGAELEKDSKAVGSGAVNNLRRAARLGVCL